MGSLAVLSALPIPFIHNFYIFLMLVWFLLFFGGFILPPITGIMLNSVTEYQRTSANSFANLAYNMFGYAPAPMFYGMISMFTGQEKSRVPLGCLLYTTIITISLLVNAIYLKIEKEDNMALQNMNPLGVTGTTFVNKPLKPRVQNA